ncbi:MAG: toprim domain-containing protein [Alphaproteobacteria bacterium]|nr:toprim domain-containing protein [Alphaproteobacteria bacterium]
MSAEKIARTLGGHRAGAEWTAQCPAHEDSTPSLALCDTAEGRVLLYCHAGCEQEAVITALRERGLWGDGSDSRQGGRPIKGNAAANARRLDDKARIFAALRIWAQSVPASGTVIETYLRSRGITMAPPANLKCHSGLLHPTGSTQPAMVALVTSGESNQPIGIHRTFLEVSGNGKADVKPEKMMMGPCRGGAVRLGTDTVPLLIGEGIETCLSAMQATGLTAWAALSTSGMVGLSLPSDAHDIVLLADGDAAGERAAVTAARHFHCEARRVRIARAPLGTDFNDLLRSCQPTGVIP